jgi:hypothetical protein
MHACSGEAGGPSGCLAASTSAHVDVRVHTQLEQQQPCKQAGCKQAGRQATHQLLRRQRHPLSVVAC